ncbi:hypothetical protein AAF712_004549 [Marasmius tenuissimus]|uniref:Uncharacterized protein n=1 Tax=Marasmius tenuissimus TaxID=585030 RepID=A0ABR3A3K7_9AGAR
MVIESLAPQRATRYEEPNDYKGFEGLDEIELAKVRVACEVVPKVFPEALSALTNLRSITWGITGPDQDTVSGDRELIWTHKAFSELWNLPHLNDIVLGTNCQPAIPLPPLHGLRHLQHFTIKGNWRVSDAIVSSSLSPVFANNPGLITLNLSPWHAGSDHRCSFRLLFGDVAEDTPPRRLEHLHLHGWFATLPTLAIPHFRNLQSLTLPYVANRYVRLWGVFQREEIHLRDIAMCNVGDEVLDYLESYSGLETLLIKAPETTSVEEIGRLSGRLYKEALPRHAESLYLLDIGTIVDSPFSVGLDNAATLSHLKNLETLDVPLRSNDIIIRPGEGADNDVVVCTIFPRVILHSDQTDSLILYLCQALLVTTLLPLRCFDYLALHPNLPPHNPFMQRHTMIETRLLKEQIRLKIVDSLQQFRLNKDQLPRELDGGIPPFLVNTLTPNGHYLAESKDDPNVLVFVREDRFDADDAFHFIDVGGIPLGQLFVFQAGNGGEV